MRPPGVYANGPHRIGLRLVMILLSQQGGGRPAMSLRTLHRRAREVAAWRRPRLVA
jgi:hypothetical protein